MVELLDGFELAAERGRAGSNEAMKLARRPTWALPTRPSDGRTSTATAYSRTQRLATATTAVHPRRRAPDPAPLLVDLSPEPGTAHAGTHPSSKHPARLALRQPCVRCSPRSSSREPLERPPALGQRSPARRTRRRASGLGLCDRHVRPLSPSPLSALCAKRARTAGCTREAGTASPSPPLLNLVEGRPSFIAPVSVMLSHRSCADMLSPPARRYHVPRDSPEWTAGVERASVCVPSSLSWPNAAAHTTDYPRHHLHQPFTSSPALSPLALAHLARRLLFDLAAPAASPSLARSLDAPFASLSDPSAPTPVLTLHTADKLSHLNPDAAMSDDEGGGAGLTESGRPKRRAVR